MATIREPQSTTEAARATARRPVPGLLVATAFWAVLGPWACGDSAHGPDRRGPVARLTATESRFVPGRIELDGSRSEYVGAGGRIRAHIGSRR